MSNSLRPAPVQEFPDVERLHKAKQLDKMCSKGLWGVRSLFSAAAVGIIVRAQLRFRLYCKILMAWVLGLLSFHSGF